MLLADLAAVATPPDVVGAAICARRCSTIERVRKLRIGAITYRYVHIDIYVYIVRIHSRNTHLQDGSTSFRLNTIHTKRAVVLKNGYYHYVVRSVLLRFITSRPAARSVFVARNIRDRATRHNYNVGPVYRGRDMYKGRWHRSHEPRVW